MDPAADLDRLRAALAPHGLNHVGVVGRARYDAVAPERVHVARVHADARSIVVVGSGGRTHWDAFVSYVAADPIARLARRAHPMDDYCGEVFAGLSSLLPGALVVFPTFRSAIQIDFIRLAELAGLGRVSELGILVSERFGPWFGLRAAIFTPLELPESPHAPRLCDGCPAPCRAACPPRIVGPAPFPWLRCMEERSTQAACRTRCGAREDCVVAPEHMYPLDEREYHSRWLDGRRQLCERFGVTDEI